MLLKKGDNELHALLGIFNRRTKRFDIGGKSLKLTKEDVVRTFGVKGGEKKVLTSADKCTDNALFKNFIGIARINTAHISRALRNAVAGEGGESNDNVASLIILYLITSTFAQVSLINNDPKLEVGVNGNNDCDEKDWAVPLSDDTYGTI